MVTSSQILDQLDMSNSEFMFPMMDNGNWYPASTRLSGYRDEDRWALVIELIGFNYRGGGHNGISNRLYIYGNCLEGEPGFRSNSFLNITKDYPGSSTFDDEEHFYLNPDCSHFLLRGDVTPIVHDRMLYLSSGIILEDESRINAFEFLRLLDVLHHNKLVASEGEIRDRIPKDIARILLLEEWRHPNVVIGETPGNSETFIQLANVLVTGDLSLYRPTNKPNTHWSNWPDGGTL